jgi:Heterokaryon incompatibility protein (HET)
MAQYQYARLGEDEIRLVRLCHSSLPGNIECDIQHVQLHNCPPYIALSYTWGDPFGHARTVIVGNLGLPSEEQYSAAQDTITLNGQSMKIRNNLYSFLQHARPDMDAPGSSGLYSADLVENERELRCEDPQSDTLGYFWVDAICIDQKNIAERNSQVARMAEIYEKLTKIVAWLGPADHTTDVAIDTIPGLVNTFERILAARGWTWDEIGPSDAPKLNHHHLAALKCIRTRPWWSRAWIIQEISTPSRYPLALWCGQAHFSLDQVVQINLALLFTSVETSNLYNSRIILLERLRHIRKDSSMSGLLNLKNLLKACWSYEATDPRDKVYAILSMTVYGQHESLLPDYSVPAEKLYYKLAVHVINHDNNLEFLSFCDPGRYLQTPSWVPDWSIWKSCGELSRPKTWMLPSELVYHASGRRAARITFSSNNQRLIVEGIEIDVIIDASEPRSRSIIDRNHDHKIAISWLEFLFPDDTVQNYVDGSSVLDVAGHVLCADVSWQNAWTEKASFSRGNSASSLLRNLMCGEKSESWHELFSLLEVNYITLFRRLIRTQQKFLGICSKHAQPGDRICILFGSQVPFVLRPAGAFWEVIGEAYIHGIMDGEALNKELNIRTFELC